MTDRPNPDALPGAPAPRAGIHRVNGTGLYAEVRGSGPPVLIIGTGDEDAEMYRPIAERLDGCTVVTYDRRGTGRSGREDWPGGGSTAHADDAAALLRALGLAGACVFGASAAGIVALQLALRHPGPVGRALIYEPGYLRMVDGAARLQAEAYRLVDDHLAGHPGDWTGARAVLGRAIAAGTEPGAGDFFEPPPGRRWYEERAAADAEALIRDDLPATTERVDEAALASAPVDIRFAHGSATLPMFVEITTRLAAVRGTVPDVIDSAGHMAFYHPERIASYILDHVLDQRPG